MCTIVTIADQVAAGILQPEYGCEVWATTAVIVPDY